MRLILSLLLVIILVQPASAQSWFERIFGSSTKSAQEKQAVIAAAKSFTEEERKRIRDYFLDKVLKVDGSSQDDEDGSGKKGKKKAKKNKGKSKGLPPGLAKKESLPPGLAKQLEKNGTLPPGLAKRSLPGGLEDKLIHRKGHDRVIVDRDVVLIEKATGKILDILRDVVVGQ